MLAVIRDFTKGCMGLSFFGEKQTLCWDQCALGKQRSKKKRAVRRSASTTPITKGARIALARHKVFLFWKINPRTTLPKQKLVVVL